MAINHIPFEDVRICFRNFSGRPTPFNKEGGDRNFCMIFNDPEQALAMREEGWNIKQMRPRDDEEEPPYYMQVKVRFGQYPPKIVLITSRGQTLLDEETVVMLDTAEIARVDLIVRPYTWEVRGGTGITAYVKAMYVTIVEDEFERRYSAPEMSAIDSMTGNLPFC